MSYQAPYTVQLDPDSARNLATHGATILLLDVPLGTPVGMDQQVFLTGPQFKGVKMIPPGVHFFSYQALGKDGAVGPPVSTLLDLKSKQVYIRKWDPATEGFVPLADEDEEARYAAGVARFDFDRGLAPYDLNRYSQWVSLSCHISQQLLDEVMPAGGEISIMCEASLLPATTTAEKRLQQQLEEGRVRLQSIMQIDHPGNPEQQQEEQQEGQQKEADSTAGNTTAAPRGERCHYTQLPRLLKVPGTSAAQLTALNMDKTNMLDQALQRYSSSSSSSSQQQQQQQQGQQQQSDPVGIHLVGELQLAFIAFVFGQSLEGYMQWKQLLVLFLGCISGPFETHTQLFISLLTALTAQLQLGLGIGGHSTADTSGATAAAGDASGVLLAGGLVDELLPDSFLRSSFRGFFEVLQESSDTAPAALLAQARVLESVLAAGLGWDFRITQMRLGSDDDDDDDEDGPVVVELTEQQLAELQGS